MKKKIVIGLAGTIASGKDTVADYVAQKYGGESVSFSQPLRDILKRIFLPINRINLSKLSQSLIDTFGGDVLSKTITEEIKVSSKEIFILPNIRRESDYFHLENEETLDFILVGLNTNTRTCYDRLVQRNQNVDDQTKTWEQFQEDLKLSTEVEIANLIKKADYQLDNNSTKEELYNQVDKLIAELQSK